jgi:hypothetical protein
MARASLQGKPSGLNGRLVCRPRQAFLRAIDNTPLKQVCLFSENSLRFDSRTDPHPATAGHDPDANPKLPSLVNTREKVLSPVSPFAVPFLRISRGANLFSTSYLHFLHSFCQALPPK